MPHWLDSFFGASHKSFDTVWFLNICRVLAESESSQHRNIIVAISCSCGRIRRLGAVQIPRQVFLCWVLSGTTSSGMSTCSRSSRHRSLRSCLTQPRTSPATHYIVVGCHDLSTPNPHPSCCAIDHQPSSPNHMLHTSLLGKLWPAIHNDASRRPQQF